MNTFVPIKGYENRYAVSPAGEVYTHVSGRLMKPCPNKKGYPTVRLHLDHQAKTHFVHRLVAGAFLGEHPGLCVNHKDGNKLNNCVENLEWVTTTENLRHAVETGLRLAGGANEHWAKLTEAQGSGSSDRNGAGKGRGGPLGRLQDRHLEHPERHRLEAPPAARSGREPSQSPKETQ